jgi:hypothetical protein
MPVLTLRRHSDTQIKTIRIGYFSFNCANSLVVHRGHAKLNQGFYGLWSFIQIGYFSFSCAALHFERRITPLQEQDLAWQQQYCSSQGIGCSSLPLSVQVEETIFVERHEKWCVFLCHQLWHLRASPRVWHIGLAF